MTLKPRLALSLAGACGLLLGAVIVYHNPPEQSQYAPPCLLHRWTGLNCPGCGATRATYALLHLRLGAAVRMNLLFVVMLPFLLFWTVRGVSRWVRGVSSPEPPKMLHPAFVWSIIGLTLLFGIVRNLPWAPFNLLAPR